MTDKKDLFPCIPATIGFSLNQFRYGFVGDPRERSTIFELSELLRDFTKSSREFGKYTSLVVFYQLPEEVKTTYSVKQFEQLFWEQLNGLAAIDRIEWPSDIPIDAHHHMWEFCFEGERYFIYCATPAHKHRKSRQYETMMLAITPRWVFREFYKTNPHAIKIKNMVRKRLSNYDSASIHPHLNSYGNEDNFEWKQYFLRDDYTSLSECPFQRD
ncbi:hypothetical protein GMD78_06835 [Ornithinibacillus sp. L9]|uniref:YqcI/YcgG family protein n=1 Tax=Ornithinibacillus caprae TaxID=2678566 RepID=A0A6N8FK06_9BACI|nr:YqcI/YcgG family protein [Ornithinibacillus caprae]MUK88109.1 hypothetical protein [Ornithinibacillus caprae]